jgi:membrane-bound lytic murein transglycosylase D
LGEIAEAEGVSLSRLRRWNGLGRRSLIHPGQKLVIQGRPPSGDPQRVVYRVRRGDTLTVIARRYGVSVGQIRQWNNLPHDRIIAGESLEIFTSSP